MASQHLGIIVQRFILNPDKIGTPKIVTPAKLVPAKAGSRGREVRPWPVHHSQKLVIMSFEEKQLKLLPDVSFAGKIQGMERQLKDNQMRTLRFIYDYIKSNDCAPAKKEIAEALGVSLSAAYDRIQHLFGHGYLRESGTRQYGRNIALTEKGIRACEGDE